METGGIDEMKGVREIEGVLGDDRAGGLTMTEGTTLAGVNEFSEAQ